MLAYKKDYKAWAYIAVPMFLLSIFTFYPLIKTVSISFFAQYNSLTSNWGNFTGFQVYRSLFADPWFWPSFRNTLVLVFVSVPVSTALALLIAVALNSIKPLQKTLQTIFFIPYVTNVLAIGMVFSVMFAYKGLHGIGNNGLINTLFNLNINWVGKHAPQRRWMFVVLFYTIWNGLPFKILVFMGGLQNISKQYYDAAKIDSASPRRVLGKITVPLLSPMISYVLITSFIGAFKSYESVLSVAGDTSEGGRYLADDRWTVVAYVYDSIDTPGLNPNNISYYSRAASASVVLFVVILLFTVLNLYVSKKRVHF